MGLIDKIVFGPWYFWVGAPGVGALKELVLSFTTLLYYKVVSYINEVTLLSLAYYNSS
jgi:hypothetical protein